MVISGDRRKRDDTGRWEVVVEGGGGVIDRCRFVPLGPATALCGLFERRKGGGSMVSVDGENLRRLSE